MVGRVPVERERRPRRRERNSVVMMGRGRVEGPAAWRIKERVFRKRGRRGWVSRGELLFALWTGRS